MEIIELTLIPSLPQDPKLWVSSDVNRKCPKKKLYSLQGGLHAYKLYFKKYEYGVFDNVNIFSDWYSQGILG